MAASLFPQLLTENQQETFLFEDLDVELEEARSILRPQRDPHFGFGFALSPYRGCGHGCLYCYVREYPNALHGVEEWGKWSSPKMNAPELLWNCRHRVHNQSVFISTATDPYQPIEREFRITRACLEILLKCRTARVMLHTKSPLVLQDIELLCAFGDRLSIGFSIPTDDDTVRQIVEPKAPPIPSRWAAVERLTRVGINVHLAVTPMMLISDLNAFARRAKESGVCSAWVGGLRLIGGNDPFFKILSENNWLKVLDSKYRDEVRETLNQVIPPEKKCRLKGKLGKKESSQKQSYWMTQPGLFDSV